MYNQLGGKTKARRPTRRTPMDTSWKAGLQDVIAARSAVCAIDGAAGRLFYRGYEIGELAGLLPVGGVTPPLLSRPPPPPARAAPPGGSHAASVLRLLEGREPSEEVTRVMDVALTLHADHEFNASTFAARVAVATLADLHAAVVAAIATLKGPRHGGANEDVLRMLQEIGDPAKAEAFVGQRLGARGTLSKAERADPRARVPGLGHRVYRVDDARGRVLRGWAKTRAEATGRERLFEVAERVYDAMKARTDLPVNVDFFSAVVYDALGIPADLCTSIFAIGRVAGWCAHAMEQYADNRLIRPRADYVGVAPRRLAREG